MNSRRDVRLSGLLKGPWIDAAADAEDFLRPPKRLLSALAGKDLITIQDLKTTATESTTEARRRKIARVLRGHWKTEEGVVDPEEIELRDSFDEALTTLQLLELGAESSYLSEAVVIREGKARLLNLLWSTGARSFVRDYDYLGVRFLAARCDIDLGLPRVTAPRPDQQAQVQFGVFLSQHQGWYGDENLDWWLGLLDDYAVDEDEFEESEDGAFHRFLRSGKLPCASADVEARFQERADGLNRFLFFLSSLFSFLPPETGPIYGSLYLYWMARFFGSELGNGGYQRDASLYYDWSRVVTGPVLCATEGRRRAVREQIKVIRQGFRATKSFVEKHL